MIRKIGFQAALKHQQAVLFHGSSHLSPGNQNELLGIVAEKQARTPREVVPASNVLGDHDSPGGINGNFFFHNAIIITITDSVNGIPANAG